MDDFEEKLNSILSSPEAMGQIMALANSLSGQPEHPPEGGAMPSPPPMETPAPPPSMGDDPFSFIRSIDPRMMERVMGLYREYNKGGDEKAALLQAMRPFLRVERQQKLDKAIQITKVSRVIRAALQQFKGEQHV